jgi:Flp pilus assembly protein protease CpaA
MSVRQDEVSMNLLNPDFWALWCAGGLMVVAAAINARTLRVPNRLSLSATVGGWVVALLVSSSIGVPSQGGGIVASLAGSAVGFILLLPFYAPGLLGGGCVKMQIAFGAWVGCALPIVPAAGLTAFATLAGVLVTIIAPAPAILSAKVRRKQLSSPLFPAQVTMSLGSVGGMLVPFLIGWI